MKIYLIKSVKYAFVVAFALLSLLFFLSYSLLFSEWLPQALFWGAQKQGLIESGEVRGRLSDQLTVSELRWTREQKEGGRVGVHVEELSLFAGLEWLVFDKGGEESRDGGVTAREWVSVGLHRLAAQRVTLMLPPSKESDDLDDKTPFIERLQKLTLPELHLPVALRLQSIDIETLVVQQAERPSIYVTDLGLDNFNWHRSRWRLDGLALQSDWGGVELSGGGRFVNEWPTDLKVQLKNLKTDRYGGFRHPLVLNGFRLIDTRIAAELSGSLEQYSVYLTMAAEVVNGYSGPRDSEGLNGKDLNSGDQDSSDLSGEGFSIDALDSLKMNLRVEGDLNGLQISQGELNSPLGDVELAGGLVWGQSEHSSQGGLGGYYSADLQQIEVEKIVQIFSNVDASASTYSTSKLAPPLFGVLNSRAKGRFVIHDKEWQVSSEIETLDMPLLGEPLTVKGAVQLAASNPPQVNALDIKWGGGDSKKRRFWLKGSITEVCDLRGAFNIGDAGNVNNKGEIEESRGEVEKWLKRKGITGHLTGHYDISGERTAPTLDVKNRFQNLSVNGNTLYRDGRIDFTGPLSDLNFNAELSGGKVDAQLGLSIQGLLKRLTDPTSELKGEISELAVETSLLRKQRWQLKESAQWSQSAQRMSLGALCLTHETAELCTEPVSFTNKAADVIVTARGLALPWIADLLPEDVSINGSVGGEARLKWRRDASPSVEVSLQAPEADIRYVDAVNKSQQRLVMRDLSATVGYEADDVRLLGRGVLIGLNAEHGNISVDIELNPIEKSVRNGNFSLKSIDLKLLEPWMAEGQTFSGLLDLDVQIEGQLADPDIISTWQMRDVQIDLVKPDVVLSKFAASGKFLDRTLTAEAAGELNGGPLQLQLSGNWQDMGAVTATVSLEGERLLYAVKPKQQVWLSPNLKIDYKDKVVSIKGALEVPEARWEIEKRAAKQVKLSSDVVVVDDKSEQQKRVATAVTSVIADVNVTLGKRVKFKGFGASGRLTGDLNVQRDSKGVILGNGVVALADSIYKAYGQELHIDRGQFLFSGPIQLPRIDIAAARRAEFYNVNAGLRLQGFARTPVATLYAEPIDEAADQSHMPVNDREILSYIVLGRPPNNSSSEDGEEVDDSQLLTQAALSMGLARSGIAQKASKALGVKNLELATEGSGEDAQLVVGGDISDKLYLQYSVGLFAPANALILRYQINQKLYLEALSGLERALDLFYSVDF